MKPGEHQVRERAYYIWEGEGRVFGRAEEHWFRAEAECFAKAPQQTAAEQAAAATLTVQPSAPAISDAPSPAKALKPRSVRAAGAASRAVSAKAEDAGRVVEKAATKAAPAKASASKASVSKSSGAKTSAAKTSSAKASAAKASAPKTSAGKSANATAKSAPRSTGASSIALH